MPFVSYSDTVARPKTHTLVRRNLNEGVFVPIIVVVGILVVVAVVSWVRVVKSRENKQWPKYGVMAAANPIGRVIRYESDAAEPRRPRTPPALRPRTENTYVRRPEPGQRKPKPKPDSAQPTPPLYRSEVPTPERGPSAADGPILDIPVTPQDITTLPAVDLPAPAHTRPVSTQEPPPPYIQRDAQ